MVRQMSDIELSSSAFLFGGLIPRDYTADGRDISPPLRIGDVPASTQSVALVCEDPDAPHGLFTHWVIFNLPADTRELGVGIARKATLPNGTAQGTNDFGMAGYGGPSPPAGPSHRYVFRVFALDAWLELPPGATHDELISAMTNHVLGRGELLGVYGRPTRRTVE